MHDEREDCPAERLTFSRDDTIVDRGLSTTQGALDLRMDCADCGTCAIVRYHPDYPLDRLDEKLATLAPGRHAMKFAWYVRQQRFRDVLYGAWDAVKERNGIE